MPAITATTLGMKSNGQTKDNSPATSDVIAAPLVCGPLRRRFIRYVLERVDISDGSRTNLVENALSLGVSPDATRAAFAALAAGTGETLEAVAARAQQVIDAIWPSLERGDVALFGHGHALRVLTAVWLGRSPRLGQHLILDPGSMSILTHHRSTRCIGTYNLSPWRLLRNSTTR